MIKNTASSYSSCPPPGSLPLQSEDFENQRHLGDQAKRKFRWKYIQFGSLEYIYLVHNDLCIKMPCVARFPWLQSGREDWNWGLSDLIFRIHCIGFPMLWWSWTGLGFLKQRQVSLFSEPCQPLTLFPTLYLFPCALLPHGPPELPGLPQSGLYTFVLRTLFLAWNGLVQPSVWLLLISYWIGIKYWHPWRCEEALNTPL